MQSIIEVKTFLQQGNFNAFLIAYLTLVNNTKAYQVPKQTVLKHCQLEWRDCLENIYPEVDNDTLYQLAEVWIELVKKVTQQPLLDSYINYLKATGLSLANEKPKLSISNEYRVVSSLKKLITEMTCVENITKKDAHRFIASYLSICLTNQLPKLPKKSEMDAAKPFWLDVISSQFNLPIDNQFVSELSKRWYQHTQRFGLPITVQQTITLYEKVEHYIKSQDI